MKKPYIWIIQLMWLDIKGIENFKYIELGGILNEKIFNK